MSDPTHASQDARPHLVDAKGGRRVKERLVHEVRQFLFMFLYLYVLFGLFAIHEAVVLEQRHITYAYYGFALVNALVLAKVMLVAEDLHLGRRFENRPLIYPVLIKSLLFAVVFICFRVVEDLLVGWWGEQGHRSKHADFRWGTDRGGIICRDYPFLCIDPIFRLYGDQSGFWAPACSIP